MPRLRAYSLLLVICGACHHQAPATQSAKPAGDTTQRFAIEKSVTDSTQRMAVSDFIKAIQTRPTPLVTSGNYLGALRVVDSLELAAERTPSVKSMAAQLRGTFQSFVGQDSAALVSFALGTRSKVPVDSASLRFEPRSDSATHPFRTKRRRWTRTSASWGKHETSLIEF